MASASLVRCEIERRSQGAKVASRVALASSAGVVVAGAQSRATSAQPCFCAVAGGEVEQRVLEPDLLRGDERVRVSALEYPQRFLDPGTLPVVRRAAGVLGALE
jgi:hypothetical protein